MSDASESHIQRGHHKISPMPISDGLERAWKRQRVDTGSFLLGVGAATSAAAAGLGIWWWAHRSQLHKHEMQSQHDMPGASRLVTVPPARLLQRKPSSLWPALLPGVILHAAAWLQCKPSSL